jgi:hypothetical protein
MRRQALVIAALGTSSLGVGLLAAFVSQAPFPGTPLLMALGVGAVVAAMAVVAIAIWRPGVEDR